MDLKRTRKKWQLALNYINVLFKKINLNIKHDDLCNDKIQKIKEDYLNILLNDIL